MSNLEKAGEIAIEAKEFGGKLTKINNSLLDVTERVEEKIIELGGRPAFPVQISLNEMAAHNNPSRDDKTVFKEGDLVKLDIGVSIDGEIVDTAISINLGDHKKLIDAAETALEEAIKITDIGTPLWKIGEVIESTIKNFGFNPIKNLSGHSIEPYKIHAGITIPNFNNNDNRKLKKGQVIAIEPFATNGIGLVKEGKKAEIYEIVNMKNVRDSISRDVLKHIIENYKTLPFAKRWLLENLPEFKVNFALRTLEKEGILQHHNQLPEKTNGIVSQAEHTLLIDNRVKILTKKSINR